MGKALRLSEKWFRRGLWLVALVFAGFLIGLGGTIVGDLPQVETAPQLDDYLDMAQVAPLRAQARSAREAQEAARNALEQAELQAGKARSSTQTERESLNAWLATRSATQRSEQDPEVIARARALDALQQQELKARQAVQAQQQALLDARQQAQGQQQRLAELERGGRERMAGAERAQELRVFLYRLALTLPLLAVAGWLFAKKRKSTWWPFVWGFIWFALFAFFVELVPYLPSYGGYVRYAVGIIVTVLVGRFAIQALNRYLERQKQAEARPDSERRRGLGYDVALSRLAKGVCPGCERAVDLKDGTTDFCPHCGIGLFARCAHCSTRRSAFVHFCPSCGTATERP
ncbi:zinc ribbon domain-containing protein [Comamonas badia]|uniref:zinc ribbon domain-containing protein n=1 Tax=Comamonas badia TaxID=265291 RepID=UPI000426458C|nr:zinc ribbon domain-containing protein [Comamonas badia]